MSHLLHGKIRIGLEEDTMSMTISWFGSGTAYFYSALFPSDFTHSGLLQISGLLIF